MSEQNKNNQLQKVNSENSLIVSGKQKDKYLQLATQAIDKRSLPIANRIIEAAFTSTVIRYGEEKDVVKSVMKLGDLDMSKDEDYEFAIDMVANWRMLLAATKDTDPQLIRTEAIYLVDTHPDITIAELKNAIRLLTEHKLGINLPFVINFSCLFMSQVLAAYLQIKETVIVEVIKAEDRQLPQEIEVSLEERTESIKYMIVECKKHVEEGCQQVIFVNDVYNFLRKTKRLVFNDKMVEEAKAYANKQYAVWVSNQPLNLSRVNQDVKKEKELMLRQFGINYCLIDFYKNNDLQKVYSSVTVEDYKIYRQAIEKKTTK